MSNQCETILIVEDDEDIRESLKQLLEFEGYRVTTAENGQEALALLEREIPRPCLILLDLMMPVMNGWEFLQVQRQSDVIATIPVIVVSAVADRSGSPKTAGFIKKPVDIDALLKLTQQYCGLNQ